MLFERVLIGAACLVVGAALTVLAAWYRRGASARARRWARVTITAKNEWIALVLVPCAAASAYIAAPLLWFGDRPLAGGVLGVLLLVPLVVCTLVYALLPRLPRWFLPRWARYETPSWSAQPTQSAAYRRRLHERGRR